MKHLLFTVMFLLASTGQAADCPGGKCAMSGKPVATVASAALHPVQAVRGFHPLKKLAAVVTAPVRLVRGRGCGK